MRSNYKRILRNTAGVASLAHGFWAFQMQAGAEHPDWMPVITASLSVWVCYFSLVWLVEGMRSGR